MKRPELILVALVAGFVAFVAGAARDVREERRPAAGEPEPSAVEATLAVAEPAQPAAAGDTAPPIAARPDPALVQRMLESGAPGTYIQAVLDSNGAMVIRWPDRTFEPLTVWIQPTAPLPDFDDGNALLVRDGFEQWEGPTLPLRFTFVVDSARAAVHVTWADRFEGETRIGTTTRTHRNDGLIMAASIVLALHDSAGGVLPSHIVRAAAMHEVGHLLGLDHSPDSSDIMHGRTTHETREISRADRRTLQLLYRLPPGPTR